jgi:hypothetical protein
MWRVPEDGQHDTPVPNSSGVRSREASAPPPMYPPAQLEVVSPPAPIYEPAPQIVEAAPQVAQPQVAQPQVAQPQVSKPPVLPLHTVPVLIAPVPIVPPPAPTLPGSPPPPPSSPARRSEAPPAPSRSSQPRQRTQSAREAIVMSLQGRSEAAAVTAYVPPAAAPVPVPQEPLVQVRPIEVRMMPPRSAFPIATEPALPPVPDRWGPERMGEASWCAHSSLIPVSMPPATQPAGFRRQQTHALLRSVLPAFVCFLSLCTGLAIAFVVFLGATRPMPAADASVARAAEHLSERAFDEWERDADAREADASDAATRKKPAVEREPAPEEAEAAEEPEKAPPRFAPPRSAARPQAPAPKKETAKKEKAEKAEKAEKEEAAAEEPKKAAGTGTININSLPSSKAVLDGRPVGNTPVVGIPVDAGVHTVTFIHPKYGKASVSVKVAPGQSALAAHRFPFRK